MFRWVILDKLLNIHICLMFYRGRFILLMNTIPLGSFYHLSFYYNIKLSEYIIHLVFHISRITEFKRPVYVTFNKTEELRTLKILKTALLLI